MLTGEFNFSPQKLSLCMPQASILSSVLISFVFSEAALCHAQPEIHRMQLLIHAFTQTSP
jgi:hypothetical protein